MKRNNAIRLSRGIAMKKILEKINQLMDGIFNLLQAYSKVVLLAVVLIVCAQVVARKFFNYSIIWSEEVALLLMVWMAFISMAIGVAKDIHIRITLFFDLFPKPVQKAAEWVEHIVALFVGGTLLIYGCRLIKFTLHSTLPTTKWPSFILYLMIPVGGFYIIYCTILQMFFPKAAEIFKDKDENDEKEGKGET